MLYNMFLAQNYLFININAKFYLKNYVDMIKFISLHTYSFTK